MDKHFIVCDNLVKIYKVDDLEVVALQGLDLVVAPGEMVGIVGVSGSGKSTLMNILGGLDRPSAGRVWVDGQDLLKLSSGDLDRYRREKVGFVWQQTTRNLVSYLTTLENVQLPLRLSGTLDALAREYCQSLLEAVGLVDRLNHKLSELSGGQQQRVAIAVALANQPKLLLADEPTGEVDSKTALDIYQTFRTLNQEYNLATLIVSHDQNIANHVDRVVAIRDGRLAAETVRQNRAKQGTATQESEKLESEEVFEELTVLDSAGRLQIPQEYRQYFDMRGRVRLEVAEEGILIKPVTEIDYAEESERLVDAMQAAKLPHYQKAVRKVGAEIRKGANKILEFVSRRKRGKDHE
jgi:ABC-type lipoprotein export system ATPase subunit